MLISALQRGTFSDYRQLAYKGRSRVLSTARFWRPLWRALRFFISTYKFLLSVTPTPLVSTSARLIPRPNSGQLDTGRASRLRKSPVTRPIDDATQSLIAAKSAPSVRPRG